MDRIFDYQDRQSFALPPGAAGRLADIRAKLADLQSLARSAYEDQLEANRQLKAARDALKQTEGIGPKGPPPEQLRAAELVVERAKQEAERLRDRAEARQARSNTLGNLVLSIEAFLRKAPIVEDQPPVQPKLNKGELPTAAIERVRQARLKLVADLSHTRSAPVPSGEVRKLIRAYVDALAKRGAPDLYPMLEGQPTFALPMLDVWMDGQGKVPLPQIGETPGHVLNIVTRTLDRSPDFLGLICFAFGDLLIKRLDAELALLAEDGSALSAEDRAARLAELQSQILENERTEEELIRMAEAGGTEILRRADADPRAVLGVT